MGVLDELFVAGDARNEVVTSMPNWRWRLAPLMPCFQQRALRTFRCATWHTHTVESAPAVERQAGQAVPEQVGEVADHTPDGTAPATIGNVRFYYVTAERCQAASRSIIA